VLPLLPLVPPLVDPELPLQGPGQNCSSHVMNVLSVLCAEGCAAMQSFVHCWLVHVFAQLNTASHSGSCAH
jgi:hypothetical protein